MPWFINYEFIDDGEDVIFSFAVPNEDKFDVITSAVEGAPDDDTAIEILTRYEKEYERYKVFWDGEKIREEWK